MRFFSIVEKARLLVNLPRFVSLVVRLFKDVRVSLPLKLLAGIGALLIVSPLDPLADIPIIGALDDFVLLMLLAKIFVSFCPPDVVAEHATVVGVQREIRRPARRLKDVTPRA